jgi:methyl acetate hydrolase
VTNTAGFGYEFSSDLTARFVSAAPRPLPGSQARFEYPLMFDPGEHWLYGVSTDWLGRVVEAASGQRLDVYLREHVLGPLQMDNTTFFPTATPPRPSRTRRNRT